MTNAEKYNLTDEQVREIAKKMNELKNSICEGMLHTNLEDKILQWFNTKAEPTLTEDERVILRNLNDAYIKIGREKNTHNGGLYIIDDCFATKSFWEYHHLFQFIKERRRIFYKRVIRR